MTVDEVTLLHVVLEQEVLHHPAVSCMIVRFIRFTWHNDRRSVWLESDIATAATRTAALAISDTSLYTRLRESLISLLYTCIIQDGIQSRQFTPMNVLCCAVNTQCH